LPVPTTMPDPCPVHELSTLHIQQKLTTADQSAHESHTMPFAECFPPSFAVSVFPLAPVANARVLPRRTGLARQCRLVNLQRYSRDQPDICRYPVSDGESDQVTREQRIGERSEGLAVPARSALIHAAHPEHIPYQVTIVRDELE
jgi:hypothetical protein